jgi:hypothetical protein
MIPRHPYYHPLARKCRSSYHLEVAETGCDRDSSDLGGCTQRPVGSSSPRRRYRAREHGNGEPDQKCPGQLGNFHLVEWGIRRVSVCRLPHCHDGWAGHATPRMTQIHKQLGRRVLANQASVARVISVVGEAASDKPIRIPPRRVPIRLAGTSMNPGTRPARVFQLQQGNGINNQNWPVSPVQPQLSDPSARSPAGAGLRFGP